MSICTAVRIGVVAAARAPAHLLVGREVLLGELDLGDVAAFGDVSVILRHLHDPRSSISAARKGRPFTLVMLMASTRYSARTRRDSWPRFISGTSTIVVAVQDLAQVPGNGLRWTRCARATLPPRARSRRHRGLDGALGAAPAEDQQAGAFVVVELGAGDVVGDAGDLGRPQEDTSARGCRCRTRRCRCRPPSPARRCGASGRGCRGWPTGGPGSRGHAGRAGTRRRGSSRWRTAPRCRAASRHVGEQPGLGAVGQVAVGEEEDRRPVLQGDPGRLDGGVEAVAREPGGHDGDRGLAVAAVHGLQQVGLLGLGRQAGGRPAPLDVDDDQRQLHGIRARPIVSVFRSMPGPLVVVTAEGPPKAAPRAAPMPEISSSACMVRTPNDLCLDSSWRMSEAGVIGYEPRNSSRLACWAAAISP